MNEKQFVGRFLEWYTYYGYYLNDKGLDELNRIAGEINVKNLVKAGKKLEKTGKYPKDLYRFKYEKK